MPRDARRGSLTDLDLRSSTSLLTPHHKPVRNSTHTSHRESHLSISYIALFLVNIVISCQYLSTATTPVHVKQWLALTETLIPKMAPNGHAPTDLPAVDKQSQAYSRPKSYERKRSAEFKIWQKENPTQTLTYDDWKSSKHVDGISLYYATLHIWDDLTTSVRQQLLISHFAQGSDESRTKKVRKLKSKRAHVLCVLSRHASQRSH